LSTLPKHDIKLPDAKKTTTSILHHHYFWYFTKTHLNIEKGVIEGIE
jgi:hypothetical protein